MLGSRPRNLPGSLADYCARASRRRPTLCGRMLLGALRIIAVIGNALAKGNQRK